MQSNNRSTLGNLKSMFYFGLAISSIVALDQLSMVVAKDLQQQYPITFEIIIAIFSGILTAGIVSRDLPDLVYLFGFSGITYTIIKLILKTIAFLITGTIVPTVLGFALGLGTAAILWFLFGRKLKEGKESEGEKRREEVEE